MPLLRGKRSLLGKSARKYKKRSGTCPFVPNKHFRASVLFSLLSGKGNNGTLRQYYSSPKQYRQENIPKKRGIKANIGCWMKYLSPFYTPPPPHPPFSYAPLFLFRRPGEIPDPATTLNHVGRSVLPPGNNGSVIKMEIRNFNKTSPPPLSTSSLHPTPFQLVGSSPLSFLFPFFALASRKKGKGRRAGRGERRLLFLLPWTP